MLPITQKLYTGSCESISGTVLEDFKLNTEHFIECSQQLYEKICEYLQSLGVKDVTDIGCCHGWPAEIFSEAGIRYTGVEQNKDIITINTKDSSYVFDTYPCTLPKGSAAISRLCVGYTANGEECYRKLATQFRYIILDNLNELDIIETYFKPVCSKNVWPYTKEYLKKHPEVNNKPITFYVFERKEELFTKCSELAKDAQVVFKIYSDIYEHKIHETGSVLFVNSAKQTVCICYLEGYKSRNEFIPFSDMVAVYDEKGKYMNFDNIKGPSKLLLEE